MSYYFSKTLDAPFDDAVVKVKAALAHEGFGVISEIDIRQTLKIKIGVEFRPYLILGACNPALAHEALLLEDKVGSLPVVEGGKVVGIVTETDVLRQICKNDAECSKEIAEIVVSYP